MALERISVSFLFDTLLPDSTKPKRPVQEEVVAILGHEIGHWKLNHTLKMLAIGEVHLLAIFYLFGKVSNNTQLFLDFGFATQPTIIGLVLFLFIIRPTESIMKFFQNLLSRHYEFQADKFAKDLGYSEQLATALIKLQQENKGNMIPDPLYSAYNHSHPPLLERLKAINSGLEGTTSEREGTTSKKKGTTSKKKGTTSKRD